MKIEIKNVNVYITKAPQEGRGEIIEGYTPAEKALGWEDKSPEEINKLIDRICDGIHDGLDSFNVERAGNNRIKTDSKPRKAH